MKLLFDDDAIDRTAGVRRVLGFSMLSEVLHIAA